VLLDTERRLSQVFQAQNTVGHAVRSGFALDVTALDRTGPQRAKARESRFDGFMGGPAGVSVAGDYLSDGPRARRLDTGLGE
jgi:hypothetical protein